MEDPLPEIRLTVQEAPFMVLERLQAIPSAEKMTVSIERIPGSRGSGPGRMLVATPSGQYVHEGLLCQFIAEAPETAQLRVCLRACRWQPDDPPTYAIYTQAAKEVVKPLLDAYALQHGRRYRLRIPSRSSLEPHLPAGTNQMLCSFTRLANKTTLHHLDWDRFYRFIRHCHNHRVRCEFGDLRRLLVKAGFDEEKAERLADIYHHGRSILRPDWPPGNRRW